MKNKKLILILIIIIIFLSGYIIYDNFFKTKLPQGEFSEKQIKSLVKKVSKIINVPEELPAVAQIVKADELAEKEKFYTGSKDGDYVLVFRDAQKAMIYRKSEDKLINVGPVIIDQPVNTNNTNKINTNTEIKDTATVKATTTSSLEN